MEKENQCYQLAVMLKNLNNKHRAERDKEKRSGSLINQYKCAICKDTGWISIPNQDKLFRVTECSCRKKERVIKQWKRAGINIKDRRLTFDNYVIWNESSHRVKEAAIDYYNHFNINKDTRNNSILFSGQPGSGKTHLSVALAISFINKGLNVVYMPYRDVIMKIKQNMLDEEYYTKMLSRFQTCDILLIDDLFKGKITDSDKNIMFEIINYRYLH